MRNFLLTAALVAGVAGAGALPAYAASITVDETFGNSDAVTGSNTKNTFTFVSDGTDFSGILSETVRNFVLTGATLSPPTTSFAPTVTSRVTVVDPVSTTLTFDATGLIAGDTYTLVVQSRGSGVFGGTISGISNVPLPASVAMFGAALAGLGVVGVARKGRKAASAAA